MTDIKFTIKPDNAMKKIIDRREFLKKTGEGAAVAGAVALAGACAPKKTVEAVAAAARELTDALLGETLYLSSLEMKNAFSRSDA